MSQGWKRKIEYKRKDTKNKESDSDSEKRKYHHHQTKDLQAKVSKACKTIDFESKTENGWC